VKLHVSLSLRAKLHVSLSLRAKIHKFLCLKVKFHVSTGIRIKMRVCLGLRRKLQAHLVLEVEFKAKIHVLLVLIACINRSRSDTSSNYFSGKLIFLQQLILCHAHGKIKRLCYFNQILLTPYTRKGVQKKVLKKIFFTPFGVAIDHEEIRLTYSVTRTLVLPEPTCSVG
jgi:hypothetical protein